MYATSSGGPFRPIGKIFGGIDAFFRALRRGIRNGWRAFAAGPGQTLAIWLILAFTGLVILVQGALRRLDRAVAAVEVVIVVVASLVMTLLAFNAYLMREYKSLLDLDLAGLWGPLAFVLGDVLFPVLEVLWSRPDQLNVALFLLVVVGFFGASLATRQGKHLSVDAVDRILSRRSARFVKRFVGLVSAGLCFVLMQASWRVIHENSHDSFPGVRVWETMVGPVNWLVSLIPGEKYGPGTAYPDQFTWEDAKFEAGLAFDELPPAFAYVEAGDPFPLWIALLVLVGTFGIMGIRFFARIFVPPAVDPTVKPPKGVGRRPTDVVLAGIVPGALIAMALGLWLGTGWMILLAAVLLVFLGTPLFVAVGIATVAAWVLIRNGTPSTVVIDMFEATKKHELLAIPFFVLAGNLMTQGSMAHRLIAFARALLGPLPGGLGVGAIIACGIFAAISGSSPVTVIAIGTLMFPMLVRDGYSEDYSMGVLTSAGGLGIIIPPSIPMIVYAIIVGENPEVQAAGGIDVATLFKAGILPGLFIATMLSLWTFYVAWPRPGQKGQSPGSVFSDFSAGAYFATLLRTFLRGSLSLLLPVLILGGIYGLFDLRPFGINFSMAFTVTEAAAVAVIYALVVELLVYREMSWAKVPKVFADSAIMMGSLFLIIVLAMSLNLFFSFEQVPERATEWMMANIDSKLKFLIAVNLFLLALGCVMDILSAILIVAPLLAPIAVQYGIHPVHFGIMFIVNLELGYMTPPMGINLFVSSTVFERPILRVIRAVLPFLLVMLFCLVVIVWFPGLSLFFVE